MKYAALVAALLAVSAVPAVAQDKPPAVDLGDPGYGGPGCKDGTARIISGFSKQAAIFLFDEYKVGANGRAMDRVTCGIAIPVSVPAGVQVAIRNIALRGVSTLPEGVEATLSVEAFTAGTQGEVNEIKLEGPVDSGYLRFVTVPEEQLQWSDCGGDTNLRINTSLRSRGDKEANVAVDSMIVYPLATKAC